MPSHSCSPFQPGTGSQPFDAGRRGTAGERAASIGTSVSATFLLLVAAINLIVLIDIVRAFRSARRGEAYNLTCRRFVGMTPDPSGVAATPALGRVPE